MSTLTMHAVSLDDIQTLRDLCIQTFCETYETYNTSENMRIYIESDLSIEKLSKEIMRPESAFFLTFLGGEPVGFLKLNFISSERTHPTLKGLEIERIYILKSYQNKRIGQFLLNEVYKIIRTMKLDYIWLGVWEHNMKARAFYERNGFKEFGNQEFVLGNDKQRDLLLWKKPS